MRRYSYDLHVHSCLSPCADNDNTPNNIAGMAVIAGLDIIALTDHNTCMNCPAFFVAAERYGIIPIAGMELTTSEDIHIVCLFPDLDSAMAFDNEIRSHRTLIKNRKDIFGEQLILDGEDNVIGEDEFLLTIATDISSDDVSDIVTQYGGLCFPAHIDKSSNSMIATLGTLPPTPYFPTVEVKDLSKLQDLRDKHPIDGRLVLSSSDAHYLENIGDAGGTLELDTESDDKNEVIKKLFKLLGGI
jgi:PHP family Zn ribbon phosphoesterase